jgi:hypothetical protein
MRYAILICGCLVWNTGCSVRGFSNLPDGPAMPSTLRSAAAVARAEADALDQIADQNEGIIRQVIGAAQSAASGLGAPAVLTGLLGAAGGFLVPTPGQRKREAIAESKGRLGASVEPKA